MNQLPVIVIGHSATAMGASSSDGKLYEYQYNVQLSKLISSKIQCNVVDKTGFMQSQINSIVNQLQPTCVVELHSNAFDGSISGTEVLMTYSTFNSNKLGNLLLNGLYACLGRQGKDKRGLLALQPSDRGFNNICKIQAPMCLIEPFFIDSVQDCQLGIDKQNDIAEAIKSAIISFLSI